MLVNRKHLAVRAATGDLGGPMDNLLLEDLGEDRVRAVATNGHWLAVYETTGHKAQDFPNVPGEPKDIRPVPRMLLPPKLVEDLAKALPKKQTIPILECARVDLESTMRGLCPAGTVTDLESPRVLRHAEPMETDYPSWEKVVPSDDSTADMVLSSQYLKEIATLARALNGGSETAIRVSLRERRAKDGHKLTNQVVFTINTGDSGDVAYAVLMSMSDDSAPREHGAGQAVGEADLRAARAKAVPATIMHAERVASAPRVPDPEPDPKVEQEANERAKAVLAAEETRKRGQEPAIARMGRRVPQVKPGPSVEVLDGPRAKVYAFEASSHREAAEKVLAADPPIGMRPAAVSVDLLAEYAKELGL